MKYVALLFAAMSAQAGCAMDQIDITINQGVYGVLTTSGVGASNQEVTIYAAGSSGAFATTTSDHTGVYQIALPNGDYTICTSGCTTITTPSSATIRYDWTDGPGGGTWDKI